MRANPFLLAHGYDAGPTQRPSLAGALTGILATAPALFLLWRFGSFAAGAVILGVPVAAAMALGTAATAVAGAGYGRLFGRAANDRRGGWLFGMAYGFLIWAAGAVMILPAVSGGAAPAGQAAIGLFLGLICWGTTLGALFPRVHKMIHARIDHLAVSSPEASPEAAAPRSGVRPPARSERK